jgi:hypothetical protein
VKPPKTGYFQGPTVNLPEGNIPFPTKEIIIIIIKIGMRESWQALCNS